MTRRARVSPEQAGLRAYGTNRRVSGLRREEVAMLAGISAEYYTRLERGNAAGASASVIGAVAQALQLDTVERDHLMHLLDAVTGTAAPGRATVQRPDRATSIRPQIQILLDAVADLPAFVFNSRMDIVACNRLGRLLYAPMFEDPMRPVNTARFAFLGGQRARDFWPNWEQLVDHAVAILRSEAGRHPHHPGLIELIGQLSTGSHEFRVRWAAHDVRDHGSGVKTLHHPVVGRMTMPYENLNFPDNDDQYLMVYTPEVDSPAHDSLRLLASWGSTLEDRAGARPDNPSPEGLEAASQESRDSSD